jgi:hypothetical protein
MRIEHHRPDRDSSWWEGRTKSDNISYYGIFFVLELPNWIFSLCSLLITFEPSYVVGLLISHRACAKQ